MAGRYKPYPEYKDSGIEWLGNVPSHWTVSKFGFLKTVLTDFTANGSFADLKKNAVYRDEPSFARLIRLTDLRLNLENENGVWVDESAYNYLSKSALFGGEFLLANVGAHAGLFYQMPYGAGNASLAPNMFMAKFDQSRISSKYMAFVGQSECTSKQLFLFATSSSAQPKLNKDDFKSVRFCFPSLAEQKKIAKFLGHEIARIDSMIEKQQQLIHLLKEKRQATISHAVIKGLNPNSKMHDSGIKSLGHIPAHWNLTQPRYVCTFVGGGTPAKENSAFWDGDIPWVSPKDMKLDYISSAQDKITPAAISHSAVKLIGAGAVLIVVRGMILNHSVPVALSESELTINQDMKALIPNAKMNGEYLLYCLKGMRNNILDLVESSAHGTKCLRTEQFDRMVLPLPPLSEQLYIISQTKDKLRRIDELILNTELMIELAMERRTALISAAVTGKIDVRDWVAPKAEQTNKEVTA